MDQAQRAQYLEAMGIQVWQERNASHAVNDPAVSPLAEVAEVAEVAETPELETASTPSLDLSNLDLLALQGVVQECRLCGLSDAAAEPEPVSPQQTPLGLGSQQATWLVVRDTPSSLSTEEESLLSAMLLAVGQNRETVYITNSTKCSPKSNNPITADERNTCQPYLLQQIKRIQPSVILVMGEQAAQALLGRKDKLTEMRGQALTLEGTPVVVTFSVAYLLKKPLAKRLAWQDLQRAKQQVSE